jgi:para-aminobenzoate synthetase/4-amino-4-deoxychorismate lyase
MPSPPRPDLDQGVFETLLVVDGAAIELESHLARLEASLASLYAAELPAQAGEAVVRRATGLTLGRVRLTVAPGGESGLGWEALGTEIDPSLQFPPPERGAELTSHLLPGGLGPHKWVDRSLLPVEDGTVPLLLDDCGDVLETARSNVFAVIAGRLVTPPEDGRILAGLTRAAAIELARAEGIEVAQRRLAPEELLAAEEVFLTNSLRGIEPARRLDGTALHCAGEVAGRLGEGLRRRWASYVRPGMGVFRG